MGMPPMGGAGGIFVKMLNIWGEGIEIFIVFSDARRDLHQLQGVQY